MQRKNLIIALGVLVALMPFISIYRSWKDVLCFVIGALIVWAAAASGKKGSIAPGQDDKIL